ncbi:MAG: DUF485 domain-containing protein [Clostridiales bacterium]|nr:DUF485 domain-containing protein [Clostridiales bacterium]
MSHGPATEWKKDNAASIKSKVGLRMFFVYLAIYAGFILINVIDPNLMATDVGSMNLAIVYGFGLIILAIVLAIVYNGICTRAEERLNKEIEKEIDEEEDQE